MTESHSPDSAGAPEGNTDDTFRAQAFGVGIAHRSRDGATLDTKFLITNCEANVKAGARIATHVGHTHGGGTFELTAPIIREIIASFGVLEGGPAAHPNLAVLDQIATAVEEETFAFHSQLGVDRIPVVVFTESLDDPCVDASEVYLRLYLLSERKRQPNSMNLDGIFGLLNTVVWTNGGPCDVAWWNKYCNEATLVGETLRVHGVDKFPAMLDYVTPPGVRIADASRVRLGAYLSEGTTVMHEGFVNFNAGTLGPAMVEGRISAGVVVGPNSDIGGGASLMGTLSGGGSQRVAAGANCLIGANAGLGIALGNNCVVEAGLYLTAGSLVELPDGSHAKAAQLSGQSDLLFLRHSISGTILVKPRGDAWNEGLNSALHSN